MKRTKGYCGEILHLRLTTEEYLVENPIDTTYCTFYRSCLAVYYFINDI